MSYCKLALRKFLNKIITGKQQIFCLLKFALIVSRLVFFVSLSLSIIIYISRHVMFLELLLSCLNCIFAIFSAIVKSKSSKTLWNKVVEVQHSLFYHVLFSELLTCRFTVFFSCPIKLIFCRAYGRYKIYQSMSKKKLTFVVCYHKIKKHSMLENILSYL